MIINSDGRTYESRSGISIDTKYTVGDGMVMTVPGFYEPMVPCSKCHYAPPPRLLEAHTIKQAVEYGWLVERAPVF